MSPPRHHLFLLTGTAILCDACQFIPGTEDHVRATAEQTAAAELIDPASAQFRDTRVVGAAVCGEINGRNRMGAYVGFTRFFVTTDDWTARLDPHFDPGILNTSLSLCGSRYGGSACATVAEERAKQDAQRLFDIGWQAHCAPAMSSSSRAPFDPTRGTAVPPPTAGNVASPAYRESDTMGGSFDYDDDPPGMRESAAPVAPQTPRTAPAPVPPMPAETTRALRPAPTNPVQPAPPALPHPGQPMRSPD